MQIVTDKTRCIGAGQCVLTDPTLFDQSEEDGTVQLLKTHVEGAQLKTAEQAATVCPSNAISLSPTD